MRTVDEVVNELAYHPATPETAVKFAEVREAAIDLVTQTWRLIPDGPNKTLAMRALQQFVMQANCAIAMTTPADVDHPHVARVLPGPVDPPKPPHHQPFA